MESQDVRTYIQKALKLDLIGPTSQDLEYQTEILNQPPSKWYLTGFLVPFGAPVEMKYDPTADDTIEVITNKDIAEDAKTPETAAARKAPFPSSIGLSFLVPATTEKLEVTVEWGDYQPQEREIETSAENNNEDQPSKPPTEILWHRFPNIITIPISLPANYDQISLDVSDRDGLNSGLKLYISRRPVATSPQLPIGTQSVSVFVVNHRVYQPHSKQDESFIFQAGLTIRTSEISEISDISDISDIFVPRPDLRGENTLDQDEAIASLQYRDDCEYAVGHNISALALLENNQCQEISTTWIPTAEVPRVEAANIAGLELGMEALAQAPNADTVRDMIGAIVTEYANWISQQPIPTPPHLAKTAQELLNKANIINQRIAAGLQELDDPLVFQAFQIANQALATARRQRFCQDNPNKAPNDAPTPKWRPFQLAFLLLNLVSISQPIHPDRETVDLLFFPTGGGKTEAYLGLAAFTLVLRRLKDPSIYSAGLTVLMRYTLRLLTLDQLERATTLICALELQRQQHPDILGQHPFNIGLWVGDSATPNKMGKKGDKNENSARERTIAFQQDEKTKPKPIPLERCPWCGTELSGRAFQLLPNADYPTELKVSCSNRKTHPDGKPACVWKGNNFLPIIAVDEQIYRQLPCFIIATVDKFANLPWVGQTAALFGKVTHYDQKLGFFSHADPPAKVTGTNLKKLKTFLPPPDLVIQDELHLISGPLGTMVGLYETAIDALCTISYNSVNVRPKIIASTATVRRADRQIQALFARQQVEIFPPPGPDRHDSFFAKTVPVTDSPGRLYVGVAAQGRSLKVVLLQSYLALLGAAQKIWLELGGKKNPENPADPYMTLLGYFNSLRELGGSRRLVEDEVNSRLIKYGERRRYGETAGLFANRKIDDEPTELTSRISTNKVAETKRRLALPFRETEKVDVALATNMISVGLDITRLGLMVVLGQPKTAAEYIQATSRVGRDTKKPGLVVTLLNIHRPRDRSHYERFAHWHRTFYRAVEATSVTPFSPRALDRGLAGVTVALSRLGKPEMTEAMGANYINQYRKELDEIVVQAIAQRAAMHSPTADANFVQDIEKAVSNLLDTWEKIVIQDQRLQYQKELEILSPLLLDPYDPQTEKQTQERQKFKAQRSLRDVEPVVKLKICDPGGVEVTGDW
jgi:hypothetical protein